MKFRLPLLIEPSKLYSSRTSGVSSTGSMKNKKKEGGINQIMLKSSTKISKIAYCRQSTKIIHPILHHRNLTREEAFSEFP